MKGERRVDSKPYVQKSDMVSEGGWFNGNESRYRAISQPVGSRFRSE